MRFCIPIIVIILGSSKDQIRKDILNCMKLIGQGRIFSTDALHIVIFY